MPNEFYLIIFLLVVMLVFVYFYAKRAQARDSVRMTKVHDEKPTSTDSEQTQG